MQYRTTHHRPAVRDRNHWEDIDHENARRRGLGMNPRIIRRPHPADDKRRAESWISCLGFVLAILATCALLGMIHGF